MRGGGAAGTSCDGGGAATMAAIRGASNDVMGRKGRRVLRHIRNERCGVWGGAARSVSAVRPSSADFLPVVFGWYDGSSFSSTDFIPGGCKVGEELAAGAPLALPAAKASQLRRGGCATTKAAESRMREKPHPAKPPATLPSQLGRG